MVFSEVSGVMFTLEPVSGDRRKLVINASWGLGEAIVSGQVTPDEFVVDKMSMCILSKSIFKKDKRIVPDVNGGTKWDSVPVDMRDKAALNDEEILELTKYGLRIEQHYGVPQDIEWSVDKDGKMLV